MNETDGDIKFGELFVRILIGWTAMILGMILAYKFLMWVMY